MYLVRVICPKCGRATKFESTDRVRKCPLCPRGKK